MDRIRLQTYSIHGSVADIKSNPLKKVASKKKVTSGHGAVTGSRPAKEDLRFLEYFINDFSLSELLDRFYNDKTSILDSSIGALGSNPKTDIIKVKQLLGKKVADAEIRQIYPGSWTEEEFEWYLEKHREELANPEVLIYCCAECGDYDCGGIAVLIERTDECVRWVINDSGKSLRFEFDKYQYYEVFNKYLQQISR
ncbi:hypothetical protein [Paraflavitalea sp. CAU 1676]|uniref:hypothetical protein n=1 Tax=Paraflavitalea sp. CAU 1676 TaxID=3032598 RepID=UPI0023D9BD09|nr:hypothetical protein [Paraflavitalea sp. CAU 1676]MDF2188529.1 hypothetical protein [Paraflavitalea sp. CAU 1676]